MSSTSNMAGCRCPSVNLCTLCNLTDIHSGHSYATVSAVLPIVHVINNNLLKDDDGDSTLTNDIKQHIKQDLNECYTESKLGKQAMDILKIATVLDPCFKMKYLTDCDSVKKMTLREAEAIESQNSQSSCANDITATPDSVIDLPIAKSAKH